MVMHFQRLPKRVKLTKIVVFTDKNCRLRLKQTLVAGAERGGKMPTRGDKSPWGRY